MITLFFRILIILVGFPLLIVPTLYATARNLNELPWGFNKLYGNAEDGWNGNGEQRRYWKGQGWWPNYLGIVWSEQSFLKRWWLGYKWCAFRNPAWILRLIPFFSISVEPHNVFNLSVKGNTLLHDKTGTDKKWYTVTWVTIDNEKKKASFVYKRLYKNTFIALRWGWKVYPDLLVTKKKMPLNKDRSIYSVKFKIVKNVNN
jgi:hypothetical protein